MKLEEIAIFTDQVAESTKFYQSLGGKTAYQNENMAVIQFENVNILIHARYEPGEGDLPCENHIAFGTTNLDAEIERLKASDTVIEYPPANYDWGRSAYLRDPNGLLVELSETE